MQKNQSQLEQFFTEYLENQVFDREPHTLYAPIDYIMALGGKRLRPLLTLMGCQMFGRPAGDALPAALAVEVFHNFSLVHDDIMDEAPLRRGMPTVHQKYNANTAILSGDAMLIEAYRFLCQSPADASLPRLMHIFNHTALEVCEGQAADMDFEKRDDVSLPEYLRMIEQKTAALIGGALALGAVIGGASEEDAAHLDAFGRNIGIAFQIQDDLLDTFGDPEKFGKKTGGDIARNKKTFLLLKALESATPALRQELMALYSETSPALESAKIERVKAVFSELQTAASAQAAKTDYQQRAFQHLAAI
ncbi:MAG TPA: polyprenyl synthetase family protein, partial [Saprospiraceae bacterium]|nr:polyprenyl synthetase family protein [Saprospiraceae bacterium]